MHRLHTLSDLETATVQLVALEPRFAAVIARHGLPSLRPMPPTLESLLRIVTDQVISLKAGETIWRRIAERLKPFDPDHIVSVGAAELQSLGLSGAKARTFVAAALAAREGRFDPSRLESQSDAEAIATLTGIAGIGPWTADIYLLTAMGRGDAWPAGDLALQLAAQDLLGLAERPSHKIMLAVAEPWRPVRAAAARLLWSHYRGLKGMPQAAM